MSKKIKENNPTSNKLLKNTITCFKLIRSSRYDKVTMGYKVWRINALEYELLNIISDVKGILVK